MLHRHCQIDHGEPVDSGGRGQSMGSERVLTGAVVPNEPNSARVSPGGVNPQRQDCRVASLLAMTSAGREPVMSNKPNSPHFGAENEDRRKNEANFWGREAPDWGSGIGDSRQWGRGMSNEPNFGGTSSRRARPALRDGCGNTGRAGMSNKANLCVFNAENGVRRGNEANSPGSWRPREIRSTKPEIRKVASGLRVSTEMANKANLSRTESRRARRALRGAGRNAGGRE